MSRVSLRSLPCPRDVVVREFLKLEVTVLPVPSIVRAYVTARSRARETHEDAWLCLKALEELGLLRRKPVLVATLAPREAALCPPAIVDAPAELPEQLSRWVFAEAELCFSLEEIAALAEPRTSRAAMESPDQRPRAGGDLRNVRVSRSGGSFAARVSEATERAEDRAMVG